MFWKFQAINLYLHASFLLNKKSGTMKKHIKTSISLFLLLFILTFATPVMAGSPPPPPPAHGNGGNVPGGGAPIGEGLIILVALGAAYGYKKWNGKKEE
jgi:hypothetical protein